MDDIEIIKQGYQALAEGKIEEVLSLFDPDIELNVSQGFPFYSGEGIYYGPEAAAQKIFAQIPVYYENFSIDIQNFIADNDNVVMVGYYTGVWKETGKRFKANATHVWTVKNGKAVKFFQAVDTGTIMS